LLYLKRACIHGLVYVTHSLSEAQEIGLRTIELSVAGVQQPSKIHRSQVYAVSGPLLGGMDWQ
jgi:hypothetical protein